MNPRPLGYEPYDVCLCRLASSLVAALSSEDGRRAFVSGPLRLPHLKPSRCVLCTNPCTDLVTKRLAVPAAGDLRIGGCSQAEVGGVVAEKYAEPSWAIFSDPATYDDAAQGDGLTITTLQTEQTRTVTAGISARQVTYLQPLHQTATALAS